MIPGPFLTGRMISPNRAHVDDSIMAGFDVLKNDLLLRTARGV